MQKVSKSVHWFWNYDTDSVKSLTPKNVILRNQQIKLSYSHYWRVASFKHLLMTHTLFVCVRSIFFWCRKDWRNWFHWKGKIDSMAPPLGNWLYPKSEQVAIQLILGGRVTYYIHTDTLDCDSLYLCLALLFLSLLVLIAYACMRGCGCVCVQQ